MKTVEQYDPQRCVPGCKRSGVWLVATAAAVLHSSSFDEASQQCGAAAQHEAASALALLLAFAAAVRRWAGCQISCFGGRHALHHEQMWSGVHKQAIAWAAVAKGELPCTRHTQTRSTL